MSASRVRARAGRLSFVGGGGLVAVAVAAGLGLSACGSSGSSNSTGSTTGSPSASVKPPTASQSVGSFVSSFLSAAASGNCQKLRTLYPEMGSCHGVVEGYRSAHEVGVAQYGTGALADFTGTSAAGTPRLTLLFVVGTSGKWQAIDSVPFGHKSVGTAAPSVAPFKAVATKAYHATASRDCASAYHYSTSSQSQSAYCAGFQTSGVTNVLATNPNPRIVSLGGTSDVQFFGIFIKFSKRLARVQHGNPNGYLTLATVKAPAAAHASLPYLAEQLWPGPSPS